MTGRPAKRRRLALWALAAVAAVARASPVVDALPPLIGRAEALVGRAEPLASAPITPSPTAAPDRLGRRGIPLNSNGQPVYPATWLNINDMSTVGALSNVAVVRMQTWRGSVRGLRATRAPLITPERPIRVDTVVAVSGRRHLVSRPGRRARQPGESPARDDDARSE